MYFSSDTYPRPRSGPWDNFIRENLGDPRKVFTYTPDTQVYHCQARLHSLFDAAQALVCALYPYRRCSTVLLNNYFIRVQLGFTGVTGRTSLLTKFTNYTQDNGVRPIICMCSTRKTSIHVCWLCMAKVLSVLKCILGRPIPSG